MAVYPALLIRAFKLRIEPPRMILRPSRLEFGPQGWDLCGDLGLETGIPALRLGLSQGEGKERRKKSHYCVRASTPSGPLSKQGSVGAKGIGQPGG